MTSLTWLRANKTHLSEVPDSLTKLNKLEDLILSRNEIKELPQEITEMAGLRVRVIYKVIIGGRGLGFCFLSKQVYFREILI